ncbi:hypothetical protein GCM10014715_79180 [Streptomyces spiralis]|uniref:DUF4232 domain-containing protein n=1 Tax=Streptomyces spiralis TaxID=66376 RepID=A0A919AKA7_9ACTN|nr:DUF4232 domain-containing protein [Streptomyces spiralis]GHF11659.1 hypothetical protein GCM10014715_79180 [Streptomyces spiralis]
MRAFKTSALALAAVAMSLALTACDPNNAADNVPTAPANSADPSAASADSDSAAPAGSSAPEADESPVNAGVGEGAARMAPCAIENLDFRQAPAGDVNEEGTVAILVRNTGDVCEMYGFPTVAVESSQYGAASVKKSHKTPVAFDMPTGYTAWFDLHYRPNTTGGHGITYDTVTVMPPHETAKNRTVEVAINTGVQKGGDEMTVDPFVNR